MIPSLQRVTTEYVETEDRIRLNGLADEDTLCIWLSKRLADRLVTAVTQLLEQQHVEQAEGVKNDLLSFSQQAAQQRTQRDAEEPVAAAVKPEASWLVLSVQITPTPHSLRMTLVGKNDQQKAELNMGIGNVRQWLNILFSAYKRGQWSTDAWPEWMHSHFTPKAAQGVESKKIH
ncbi:hypothetical protein [Oceanospirillum beijerinckii]|uniref:hypothetical protein n=1 Tax=Oceanospirillum beijerinckii TaxID=64976 RepID=UPI0003FE6A0B|nr:hypothetical protein [Oceanospirillum beijerinckii]MAC47815.1 hypothetical protein [Oceanospirillum sp.]